MKNLALRLFTTLLLFIFGANTASAQMANPVKWTIETTKMATDEYQITFTAQVSEGWYLYSQHLPEANDAVPTTFEFQKNPAIELQGKTEESGNRLEVVDRVQGVKVVKYTGKAVFTQKVKSIGAAPVLSGIVTYMTCTEQHCLPPKDMPFNVDLTK